MGQIFAVIDRSGSMGNCVTDTIGGFNAFIDGQRADGTEIRLTTVLFDNEYQVLHHDVPLLQVKKLTKKEYFVRGNTALFDAMGRTITDAIARVGKQEEADAPERVVFLVMTDGMENASQEFTTSAVKALIEDRKRAGWEFFFLGADLDNLQDAENIGVEKNRSTSFSKRSMHDSYVSMSKNVTEYMTTGLVSENWDASFRKDDTDKKD
jgi:uncharacterized protein YegL